MNADFPGQGAVVLLLAESSTTRMGILRKGRMQRYEHDRRDRPEGRSRGTSLADAFTGELERLVLPAADAAGARFHARGCRAVELGGYLHGKQRTHYRGPSANHAIVRLDHVR